MVCSVSGNAQRECEAAQRKPGAAAVNLRFSVVCGCQFCFVHITGPCQVRYLTFLFVRWCVTFSGDAQREREAAQAKAQGAFDELMAKEKEAHDAAIVEHRANRCAYFGVQIEVDFRAQGAKYTQILHLGPNIASTKYGNVHGCKLLAISTFGFCFLKKVSSSVLTSVLLAIYSHATERQSYRFVVFVVFIELAKSFPLNARRFHTLPVFYMGL